MTTFLSPGLKVTQVNNGPVVTGGIATAIGGFLVYTQKGPTNTPVLVTSPANYQAIFGTRHNGANGGVDRGWDSVNDFFSQGGKSCYVVRFIGAGSAAASRTLSTGAGNSYASMTSATGPFQFTDGATLTGAIVTSSATLSPAPSAAVVAKPATLTGTGSPTFAPGTNNIVLSIPGIPGNQTITFASEATVANCIIAINTQLRGASAILSGGQIKITTDKSGTSASTASLVSGTAAAALGFPTSFPAAFTQVAGSNVSDVDYVTATELANIFNTAVSTPFTGTTFTTSSGKLVWTQNTAGSTSSIKVAAGSASFATTLGGTFSTTVVAGGTTSATPLATLTCSSNGIWGNQMYSQWTQVNQNVATVTVTDTLTNVAGSTASLTISSASRLAIGDQISAVIGGTTVRSTVTAIGNSAYNGTTVSLSPNITIPGGGCAGTEAVVLETSTLSVYNSDASLNYRYPNLRMSSLANATYFVNAINQVPTTQVTATDLAPSLPAGTDARPASETNLAYLFAGGLDGSAPVAADVIGTSAAKTGWYAFNLVSDVNMISCPGIATDITGANGTSIIKAGEAYALARGDVQLILDAPSTTPATGITGVPGTGGLRDYITNIANLSVSNESIYWPWVQRLDSLTGLLTYFPPSPWVQGRAAKLFSSLNFGAAPAGMDQGNLTNAVGLATYIQENSSDYDDFYPYGGNAIINFPGEGIAIYGSRTCDQSGLFGQFNVQYVFNINKRLVRKALRFVQFRNNDPVTRGDVIRKLTALFREQRLSGILQGKSDGEAFFIICDDSNNDAVAILGGKVRVRIGLAVERPAEFIDVTMEIDTRAANAALASQAAVV